MEAEITRFQALCEGQESSEACWIWRGALSASNTPRFGNGSARVAAHRLFSGQEVRRTTNTCGSSLCINPRHNPPVEPPKDTSVLAAIDVKKLQDNEDPDAYCDFLLTERHGGHPYVTTCILIKGHGAIHDLWPAHRVFWERRQGIPIPAKMYVVPVDRNWENLDEDNWILVTARNYRSWLAAQRIKTKTCKECERHLPASSFQLQRRICHECFRQIQTERDAVRRTHRERYMCRMIGQTHYHCIDPKQRILYSVHRYCRDVEATALNYVAFRQTIQTTRRKLLKEHHGRTRLRTNRGQDLTRAGVFADGGDVHHQ